MSGAARSRGNKDKVSEFGFGHHGNIGMFEDWGALVADPVGFLSSASQS